MAQSSVITDLIAAARSQSIILRDYLLYLIYSNIEMITTGTVSTTTASTATIETIAIPTDSVCLITTKVIAKKISGAGIGANGSGNSYIKTVQVKNIAGTVTLGTIQSDYLYNDMAAGGCTFSVSGTNVIIEVTGVLNNNLDWVSKTILTEN